MTRCAGAWAKPASRACSGVLPSSGWSSRPPPFTHAWPARTAQRTLRVRLCAAEPARVHHSQMADREVVLDRIAGIEPAQRCGDVARHAPALARVVREP